MALVVNPHEVELNSVKYPLGGDGTLKPSIVSLFPDKIVTGDYTADSNPLASSLSLGDMRMGVGAEEYLEGRERMCWWSNLNLEQANRWCLGRLSSTATATAAAAPTTMTLRPSAAGTTTGISNVTGASTHWEAVDEASSDSDTTYVYTAGTLTEYDTYDVWPVSSTTKQTATISSVVVYCTSKYTGGTSGTPTHNGVVRTHGTDYHHGTPVNLTTSYVANTFTWATNPNTSAAWTWAEIAALEIGVRHSAAGSDRQMNTTQVYAIVNFTGYIYRHAIYAEFKGVLYIARGTNLQKLNSAGTGFSDVKTNFTNAITDLIVFGDYLYIYEGEHGFYWYMDSDDAFTQTTKIAGAGGQKAVIGLAWDNKLWKLDATNQIWYTATPNSATPTWTANGTIDLEDEAVNRIKVYVDADGNEIIYAATTNGLYAHDTTNAQWNLTRLQTPPHPYAGRGFCVWNDGAFVSSGINVMKYVSDAQPAIIQAIGLDKEDGLPAEYAGVIVDLIPGFDRLFALVDASLATGTGTSTVMSWNGAAWHVIWTDSATDKAMYGGILASDSAYRLWFDSNDTIYYVPFSTDLTNVLKQNSPTYAAAGFIVTSWFDAGWKVGNKLAHLLRVSVGGDVSADETVVVKYRINRATTAIASTWTTLGTITSSGETTYKFPDDSTTTGTQFREIQFRFDLITATSTQTPIIYYAVLEYGKIIPRVWGWEFTVDCSQREYAGRSAAQLISALETAATTETLVTMVYRDTTYYVQVLSVSGSRATGDEQEGFFNVSVRRVF